ncbi:MAG TPA: hypothetical protein EYQ82_11725 [Dehalococcoidia bacterium]|nr:hypothetical protein [Dehalococcoidia bacterium]
MHPYISPETTIAAAACTNRWPVSRCREYGAYHTGAELTRNPSIPEDPLEKISSAIARAPVEDLRKMTAASALAIYPALRGHSVQSLSCTHPPIEDRIARI